MWRNEVWALGIHCAILLSFIRFGWSLGHIGTMDFSENTVEWNTIAQCSSYQDVHEICYPICNLNKVILLKTLFDQLSILFIYKLEP